MEGVELVPSALTPSEAVESMPGAYCIYRNASDPASVTPRVLASKVGVGGLMTPQEENNLLQKAERKRYSIARVTSYLSPRDYELSA